MGWTCGKCAKPVADGKECCVKGLRGYDLPVLIAAGTPEYQAWQDASAARDAAQADLELVRANAKSVDEVLPYARAARDADLALKALERAAADQPAYKAAYQAVRARIAADLEALRAEDLKKEGVL
jgi:hypothetical protein